MPTPLSMLFFECSFLFVNAVQLHVNDARPLLPAGPWKTGFRKPPFGAAFNSCDTILSITAFGLAQIPEWPRCQNVLVKVLDDALRVAQGLAVLLRRPHLLSGTNRTTFPTAEPDCRQVYRRQRHLDAGA